MKKEKIDFYNTLIIKIFIILVMGNILLNIYYNNVLQAITLYLFISMVFYISNYVAYLAKKIDNPMQPIRAIAWCVAVFNKEL